MREYETTLIIQPEISDEGVGALQERLDGILEGFGSLRLLYDDLGKRRLAYEIQNFQKGRYVMLRFLDEGPNITGLERALGLEDSIIRFLTVQVDEAVEDVAARQAEAAEEERLRVERAAERAAREAEETERQRAETAEAEKLAAAAKEATAEAEKLAADAKPEATPDAAPEATADAKPEATPDAAPETADDAKPEATADAEPEASADAAPEATADAKPEASADAAPEAAAEEKPKEAAKDDESGAPAAAPDGDEAAEAVGAEEVAR